MRWRTLLLLLCLQVPCLAAWLHPGWLYRTKITVQHSKVNADLTNFPIYVKLGDFGSGHGFWSHVLSSGADIRVTSSDGTTELPIEVVKIDTSAKTGEIHFKASSLANATNSDFYLYYGNGDASAYATSATYGRNNVWTGYGGVWHLQQDPSGSAPQEIDSTGNNNNLTSAGSMTASDLVAGQISNGIDLDGSNDKLTASDSSTLEAAAVTVQTWIKSGVHTGVATLVGRTGGGSGKYKMRFGCASASDICMQVSASGLVQSPSLDVVTDYLQNSTTWYMIHGTYSSTDKCRIYKNGTEKSTGTSPNGVIGTTSSQSFETGASTSDSSFWPGVQDEVRMIASVLSSTWISTEYNNQGSPSTFYTVSSEESNAAPSSLFMGFWF